MTPAGYMAKKVSVRPEWLRADGVVSIFSLSGCMSSDFADYVNYWKHNGYWLFDSPQLIREIAQEDSLDLSDTRLFYYEVHELEFDEKEGTWNPFGPETAFNTDVAPPEQRHLEGYDVVSFSAHTSAECSPLSCNSLASVIETNEHCLLSSLENAIQLLEAGRFNDTEPGPYRVFAVYSVSWASVDATGMPDRLNGNTGLGK